jgi:hypothetical protein
MILTAIIGFALLFTAPRPFGSAAVAVFVRAQDATPIQNPSEQEPPQEQPNPEHVESGAAASGSTDQQPSVPPSKTANPKRSSLRKKKPSASAANKVAPKSAEKTTGIVVVRNGGTSETQGQIASGTTVQQAPQQLKETNSLLASTASNLQKISGKELNPNQQDMVKQIHDYMQQSKSAARAGDVQGANNLAFKAHLLSQELVKH